MKNGECRVVIALLTVALTVAILFGGYSAYNVYGIEKPVKNQLSSLEPVSQVVITKEKQIYDIRVQLSMVDNLQSAYNHIEKTLNQRFSGNEYDLQIIDNRNEKLEQLHSELQPAMQQAAAQSEFVWLNDQLNEKCSQMELQHELWVDEERIYIQVQDADHYLYEIIARPDMSINKSINQ
ncbi:MAG: hypothetical protein WBK78_02585 [Syntrophomonadaceae bacterium]